MASSRRGGRTPTYQVGSNSVKSHVSTVHSDHGKASDPEKYLNTWISRYNDISFKCNGVYHGVVEKILSKGAATVVIGEKERGIPLLCTDDWCSKGVNFAKVLLCVDRLRPSIDQHEYDKDTVLRDKIKEGDVLFIVVEEAKKSPENIYKYFASSAFKVETAGKVLDESTLLKIRDPLRGIVEAYVSQDVGIIRFSTYSGLIAKALYNSNSYKSGSSSKSVAPVNTMVYLEVRIWHAKTRTQEWEKLLLKDGILFKATLVWPKNTSRPVLGGDERENLPISQRFVSEKRELGIKGSVQDLPSRSDANAKGDGRTYCTLTDIHAYYAVVEIIPSHSVAIICTAHRRGEPLSWMDNWFDRGVSIERILLLSEHVRISKNASESAKGTPIKSLLQKGNRVMAVVEPTVKTPEKCYKWFAKTCWKVADSNEKIPHIPLNLLPGHLSGEVVSIISHDTGIINFKTYHGFTVKAVFSHFSYYKSGRRILSHIPLGSEIKIGTRVHVIANKCHPGTNSKEIEQLLHEKEISYKVVMAWELGTPRPDESESIEQKEGVKTYASQKIHYCLDKNDPFEVIPLSATREVQGRFGELNVPGKEGINFADKRHHIGGRGYAWRKSSKNQQRIDDSKSCGDCVDLHDNVSELTEFLGATSVSTENLSTVSSNQSESKFPLKNPFGDSDEERVSMKKSDDLLHHTSLLNYQIPSKELSNPIKNVKVPHLDGTKSGILVSVDESWGLVQVEGGDVHDFQSNAVYMYGLKLEDVPLHRIFHQGQAFKVHMEGTEITAVEYGAPQLPNLIRRAITAYCENNSISEDVRFKLESIMKCYGV